MKILSRLPRLSTLLIAALSLSTTVRAADKQIKIGVSMYALSAPYFVAQLDAAKKAAAAAGAIVVSTDAQNDMTKQINDVGDMLSQGIDVLILNAKDAKGLVPATKQATEAKVPVIEMDSSIDPSADTVTTVQSSANGNGELVGEEIVKQLGNAHLKIALLSGEQGNLVGEARRDGGFVGISEAQLRQYGKTDWEIAGQGWGKWSQEGGQSAADDILTAHKDVNVLVAENDSMALGGLLSIKNAGLAGKVKVFAFSDGQKEALVEIKKGGDYGATGLNDPAAIATEAVDIAIKAAKGQLPAGFPKITLTPPACITKENVDKYYKADAVF